MEEVATPSPPPPQVQLPLEPGNNGLLEHLASLYGTRDLEHVDPLMGMGKRAADRARTRTVNIPMTFEGTAASFDDFVKRGIPIRMTLLQALDGKRNTFLPHRQLTKDMEQQLDPRTSFDLSTVLINKISLANPINTFSQSVGLVTNGLPGAYAEIRMEQTNDLAADLGIDPGDVNVVAHIPPSETGIPDTRQIPILKEVINGFHGEEVAKTFGGITARHMPRGIIPLTPVQAKSLGLMAPPVNHNSAKAPEGFQQGVNSWVIIPMGHILSHIVNLTATQVVALDYCVFQLKYPNGTPLPFILMDNWTLEHYTYGTVSDAILKIDKSRSNILETYMELVPVTRKTWLNSCIPGHHMLTGYVSFTMVVTYTMFPSDFRSDGFLICSLSDKFPRISFDIKKQLDDEQQRQNAKKKAPSEGKK